MCSSMPARMAARGIRACVIQWRGTQATSTSSHGSNQQDRRGRRHYHLTIHDAVSVCKSPKVSVALHRTPRSDVDDHEHLRLALVLVDLHRAVGDGLDLRAALVARTIERFALPADLFVWGEREARRGRKEGRTACQLHACPRKPSRPSMRTHPTASAFHASRSMRVTSSSHATKNSVWKRYRSSSRKLNSRDCMSCPSTENDVVRSDTICTPWGCRHQCMRPNVARTRVRAIARRRGASVANRDGGCKRTRASALTHRGWASCSCTLPSRRSRRLPSGPCPLQSMDRAIRRGVRFRRIASSAALARSELTRMELHVRRVIQICMRERSGRRASVSSRGRRHRTRTRHKPSSRTLERVSALDLLERCRIDTQIALLRLGTHPPLWRFPSAGAVVGFAIGRPSTRRWLPLSSSSTEIRSLWQLLVLPRPHRRAPLSPCARGLERLPSARTCRSILASANNPQEVGPAATHTLG